VPQITATPATVYLHCRNARCSGSNQEELEGVREETAFTFGENGGDGIFVTFIERSMVEYRVEDPEVLPCPGCGEDREATGTPRPSYMNLSGHDPMGLIGGPGFDPSVRNTEQDAEMAELKSQVARLTALITPEDE
jgi:hypothetical protein